MKWFLMLLIFLGGFYYLVTKKKDELPQKSRMAAMAEPEPALPVKPEKAYLIKFSLQTLKTLRTLTQDPDDKVRFAAIELLWQLQDESAPGVIKNMFENETEPALKNRLIDMLARDKSKLSLALLSEALKDYDKETRLYAVTAIGAFSSKEAIPALSRALQDYDEEVRLKSLEAVNRIRKDMETHKEQQLRELDSKPRFRAE